MDTTKSNRYRHWINVDLGRWWIWGEINSWELEIVEGWDDMTRFKVVPKGRMLSLHLLGWVGIVDGVKTLKIGWHK